MPTCCPGQAPHTPEWGQQALTHAKLVSKPAGAAQRPLHATGSRWQLSFKCSRATSALPEQEHRSSRSEPGS